MELLVLAYLIIAMLAVGLTLREAAGRQFNSDTIKGLLLCLFWPLLLVLAGIEVHKNRSRGKI